MQVPDSALVEMQKFAFRECALVLYFVNMIFLMYESFWFKINTVQFLYMKNVLCLNAKAKIE